MQILRVLLALVVLHLSVAKSVHGGKQPQDEDPVAEADRLANEVNADADNAKSAADTAKQAAVVANNVAEHSMKVTTHAKKALHHALGALHDARVESNGMNKNQKESLKKAEAKLREATKTADFGKLKKVKGAEDLQKEQMEADLDKKSKKSSELEQMRSEVREMRSRIKEKGGDAETEKELAELEADLERMEKEQAKGKADGAANDELKAEVSRLRDQIDKLEEQEGQVDYEIPESKKPKVHELPEKKTKKEGGEADSDKELMRDVKMQPLDGGESESEGASVKDVKYEATPVQEKGIDIDTQMPYGDLEPFGREDTAQELTEASVRESDEMVDQLERAEVAEEKRAVFRALTRLRGAAITSFDGVARSQTGNIDEYNKIHKWRKTHPMHHLADEESDISKWAFPDNADLVQVKAKGHVNYRLM